LNLEIFSKDLIHLNSYNLKPVGIADVTASLIKPIEEKEFVWVVCACMVKCRLR
jgi:hypothetical protein